MPCFSIALVSYLIVTVPIRYIIQNSKQSDFDLTDSLQDSKSLQIVIPTHTAAKGLCYLHI